MKSRVIIALSLALVMLCTLAVPALAGKPSAYAQVVSIGIDEEGVLAVNYEWEGVRLVRAEVQLNIDDQNVLGGTAKFNYTLKGRKHTFTWQLELAGSANHSVEVWVWGYDKNDSIYFWEYCNSGLANQSYVWPTD